MNASPDVIFIIDECLRRPIKAIDLFGIIKLAEVVFCQCYKFVITPDGVEVSCASCPNCHLHILFKNVNVTYPVEFTLNGIQGGRCRHKHVDDTLEIERSDSQSEDGPKKKWKQQRAKCNELKIFPLYDIYMSYKPRRNEYVLKRLIESQF